MASNLALMVEQPKIVQNYLAGRQFKQDQENNALNQLYKKQQMDMQNKEYDLRKQNYDLNAKKHQLAINEYEQEQVTEYLKGAANIETPEQLVWYQQQARNQNPELFDRLTGGEATTWEEFQQIQPMLQQRYAEQPALPKGYTRGDDGSLQIDPGYLAGQTAIKAAGRPQVNVNTAKAPKGYMWNEEGTRLIPMPGGPEDQKIKLAEEKKGQRIADAKSNATLVLGKIDKALGEIGPWTTGLGSAALGGIPSTPAFNFKETIGTVKANIGFDKLQKMRELSPTGGALGQVSERELGYLQAVLGSLNEQQSPEQITENLKLIKKHYENWLMTLDGVNPDQQQASSEVPEVQSDLSSMSDEELLRALGVQ